MAIHDPAALLNRLLEEPRETSWLEFKVNNADPQELGEYVSALANAAMLAGRDRGFLVFGVEDKTRRKVGTKIRLGELKKGGEMLASWLGRLLEPRIMLEFVDFNADGLSFSLIAIEPSYDRPVRFSGTEYFRIGDSTRKLIEFPEHERALWLATGRRKFEDAVALSNQTASQVLELLDSTPLSELAGEPKPGNAAQTVRKLTDRGFIIDNFEGRFDIVNLGAILLAREITAFPSIAGRSIRIIKYVGRDKSRSEFEQEARKGYAVGFSNMMRFLMARLPSEEIYVDGVRRTVPAYPETAIREVIANGLIHQDFTIGGSGPVVEIYDNRVEITNPGNSLIPADRMLDERRSRNEKLAAAMRAFGLCEERGGGLDKTLIEIERLHLPAPDFVSSENSMRVILFGPRPFNQLTKPEKVRACFHHCVLRWMVHDPMSNASLRDRFSLLAEEYQAVSAVIAEAVRLGRIAPADPKQGKRNARYVPYWAAE